MLVVPCFSCSVDSEGDSNSWHSGSTGTRGTASTILTALHMPSNATSTVPILPSSGGVSAELYSYNSGIIADDSAELALRKRIPEGPFVRSQLVE